MAKKNWGLSVLIFGALILLVSGVLAYNTSHQLVCTLLCIVGSTSCCDLRGAFLTPIAGLALTLGFIAFLLSLLSGYAPKRKLGAILTAIFGVLSFLALLLGTLTYTMMYPNVQMFGQSDVMILVLSLVGMAVTAIGMSRIVDEKPLKAKAQKKGVRR